MSNEAEFPIKAVPGGVEFAVRATPGSAKTGVRGLHGGALKVAVQAPPEKGKANDAVVEVLAAYLGVPPRAVTVVAGHTSRQKRVQVLGVEAAAVRQRMA